MGKVILYFLAAIGAAVLAWIAYTIYTMNIVGRVDTSDLAKAKRHIFVLSEAMESYALDTYNFPSTESGLRVLIEKPEDYPERLFYPSMGYINADSVPLDPWGNEYQYRRIDPDENDNWGDGEVYSLGPDGVPSEDDISSLDF